MHQFQPHRAQLCFEQVPQTFSANTRRISNFAKYRVTGSGAAAWLSGLLTNRLPAVGRIALTAMLNPAGRIVAEFTIAHAAGGEAPDEFLLFGSQAAEIHHSRWFLDHLPADGSVTFQVLGLGLVGLAVAGPRARDVLQQLTDTNLASDAVRFLDFRSIDLGMIPARVGRISYTGELGYELWVAPEYQQALFDRLMAAGAAHGIRPFGQRALLSLRLEKSYGTWFREYRPIYTPLEAGIGGYIRLDHEFVGRAAFEAESARGPERRLVTLVVEPDPDDPADVIGDEPIWHDGNVVGWVTSGGYGHRVGLSLALGYVPAALVTPEQANDFEIEILGRRRPATLQFEPVYDSPGRRMRA